MNKFYSLIEGKLGKYLFVFMLFTLLLYIQQANAQSQNALNFDGIDDYVNCGNGSSVKITGGTITLEAWIKADAWESEAYYGNIVTKEESNGNNSGYCLSVGDGGKIHFRIGTGNSTSWCEITTPAILSTGVWYHLAGVYDGSYVRVYVNGVEVDNLPYASKIIDDSGDNMRLGSSEYYTTRFFDGTIDEVRVWSTARTATQIRDYLRADISTSTYGLKAYYKFNQGNASQSNTSVSTLTDATSNANTGTLMNFTKSGNSSNWVSGMYFLTEFSSIIGSYSGSTDWGDFDKDGDLDLLITGGTSSVSPYSPISRIYKNNGNFSFAILTSFTGVYGGNGSWADYNNDGYLDALISGTTDGANTGGVTKLYKNNGNSTFTEVINTSLINSNNSEIKWGDYNNDGLLDLLMTGTDITGVKFSKIYKNNGDNTFSDMPNSLPVLSGSRISWGDYDNDADLDILICGYNASNAPVTKLFENNGDGTFSENTSLSLTGVARGSVSWGDYDNDGDLDILLVGNTNYSALATNTTKVFKNNGNKTFTEVLNTGLPGVMWAIGLWGDYDNDGKLDILLSGATDGTAATSHSKGISRIYKNTGTGFSEIIETPIEGFSHCESAWGDLDNDGDLDFIAAGVNNYSSTTYSTKIYKNNITTVNSKPNAPTALVSTVNNNSVTLSWTKPSDAQTSSNGLSYNLFVYNTTDSSNLISIKSDSATGLRLVAQMGDIKTITFTLKNVPCGQYKWRVQAIDAGLMGGNFSSYSTFEVGILPATALNTASDNGPCDGKIQLNWAYSSTVGSYELQRKLSTDTSFVILNSTIGGQVQQYQDIPPKDGIWSYRMLTKSTQGCTTPTDHPSIVVLNAYHFTTPIAPTIATAIEEKNSIRISWKDNSINESKFVIKRREYNNNSPWVEISSSAAVNDTTIVDYLGQGGMEQCKYYEYQVFAYDTCGYSAGSNITVSKRVTPIMDSVLTSFVATKGDYENTVKLKWTYGAGNPASKILIYRHAENQADSIYFIDDVMIPDNSWTDNDAGFANRTVYEYSIRALATCGLTDTLYSPFKRDLGFSKPYSTMSGRISFAAGNSAVPNVQVNVLDAYGSQSRFSLQLDGTNDYVQLPQNYNIWNTSHTVEMWIKPDPAKKRGILISNSDNASNGCGYEINSTGYLQILWNGVIKYTGTKQLADNAWHQISIVRIRNSSTSSTFTYYVDGVFQNTTTITSINDDFSTNPLRIGTNLIQNSTEFYKGNIDEIRIWNTADTNLVKLNFNRFVNEDASGLLAYWAIDDKSDSLLFDGSIANNSLNHYDGLLKNGALITNTSIPTSGQLAARGITQLNGDYLINRIYFTGNQQSIIVTPVLGIHSFSPGSKSLIVGVTNKIINDVDFKDQSSFKVAGTVKYKNTSCFAEGIMFKVGNDIKYDSLGSPIKTNQYGYFELDVPIGNQTITATKDGHIFENGGTYSADFQAPVSGIQFFDKTVVKLVGYAVGGEREAAKNPGFGHTINNIGVATIKFESENLCYSQTIKTDSLTGEYMVYLPPMRYKILDTISTNGYFIKSNPTLEFGIQSILDLTNMVANDTLIDSSNYQSATHIDPTNYDTLYFNFIKNFVYRAPFNIAVTDTNNNLNLGNKTYTYKSGNGPLTTLNLSTLNLPYPVFTRGYIYAIDIKPYEIYANKDKAIIKYDTVPLYSGTVSIINAFDGNSGSINLTDSMQGKFRYEFQPSEISTTVTPIKKESFTKNLDISFTANSITKTYNTKGYLLGTSTSGTNFIATGPQEVNFVLRDPPGNASYTFLEVGTTIAEKEAVNYELGVEFQNETKFETGFSLFGVKLKNEFGIKFQVKNTFNWDNSITTTTKLTDRWQTSDAPDLPGANSDLFIGKSNNYTFGIQNNITLIPDSIVQNHPATVKSPDTTNYGGFRVALLEDIGVDDKAIATTFMYSQYHIENVIIPNLKLIRNDILLNDTAYTLIFTDVNDSKFGASNDNPVWGTFAKPKPTSRQLADNSGKSYVYYPNKNGGKHDTIWWLNYQITLWENALRNNEKEKLNATYNSNYSFSGGGNTYNYSITSDTTEESTYTYTLFTSIEGSWEAKFSAFGTELTNTASLEVNFTRKYESTTTTTNSVNYGFQLADSDVGDQFLLNAFTPAESANSPIFKLLGGSSKCPHEGPDYVKYVSNSIGTVLSAGTMKRESPQISVTPAIVSNVLANQAAAFTLNLGNSSETNESGSYEVRVLNETNPHGAVVKINGVAIASGIVFNVPAGQSVQAMLTLERGPIEFDYDTIEIQFGSICDGNLASIIRVSAHFIPPCINMTLQNPLANFTVNLESKDTVPVLVKDYDANYKYLKNMQLQYKPTYSSNWSILNTYWKDTTVVGYSKFDSLVPSVENYIEYDWNVSQIPDGEYHFRVMSQCPQSTETSILATGIIDRLAPVSFGTPQPSDGILNAGEDIMIQFNEPISAPQLSYDNFSVTGVQNGTTTINSTSLNFNGTNSYLGINGINLASKSFSIEFWAKRNTLGGMQTIVSQNNNTNAALLIGFNTSNKLFLKLGAAIFTGDTIINDNSWHHYIVTFDNTNKVCEMYKDNAIIKSGSMNAFYSNYAKLYVGKSNVSGFGYFNGNLCNLRIWNKALQYTEFSTKVSKKISGNEPNLVGNWIMDDAKGTMAVDDAHNRNAVIYNALWQINPGGSAYKFTGTLNYAKLMNNYLSIPSEKDLTIEFWFKAQTSTSTQCFFSNGSGGTNTDNLNSWIVYAESNGMIKVKNNGLVIDIANGYLNNTWHQFSLSLNRSGYLNVYIDGSLVKSISGMGRTGFVASQLVLGAQITNANTPSYSNYLNGSIDDVRIWNLARTKVQIEKDMYYRLNGTESGLMMYLPFELYSEYMGTPILSQSLINIAKKDTFVVVGSGGSFVASPALKLPQPISDVNFNWTVNSDKIIINLTSSNTLIENCILDITVKDVKDKVNNKMISPKSWTAYVKKNPVVWELPEVIDSVLLNTGYSFSVKLYNHGGNVESFDIVDIPNWLTASPNSGVIQPGSYKVINFTVSTSIGIGDHIIDIGALGAFGFTETFVLNLNVRAATPNWTINPNAYSLSMNIVGQLAIDSILSNDVSDIIAAFSGTQCRGLGKVNYFPSLDKYLVFLDIYSNDSSNTELITFKVWDASEGKIRTEVTPMLNFKKDTILGNLTNPLYINTSSAIQQNIPLVNGWKWISFNLSTDSLLNVNSALRSLMPQNGSIIRNQTKFSQFDVSTGWAGTLNTGGGFNNKQMYMIKRSAIDTLIYSGVVLNTSAVTLNVVSGWNWIGFTPQNNLHINEAFGGLINLATGDVIKDQNSFSMYQAGIGWIGTLTTLKPGNGYMLKTGSIGSFTYPEKSSYYTKDFSNDFNNYEIPNAWKNNFAKYPSNMSVIAYLDTTKIKNIHDKMIVGAFVNNECIGYAAPIFNQNLNIYTFYLTISNEFNSNDNVKFRLFNPDNNEVYYALENFGFQSDAIVGDNNSPIKLTFGLSTDIETNLNLADFDLQSHPNPFNESTKIFYKIPENNDVVISVYNLLGEKITTLVDERMDKGDYSIVWNGTDSRGGKVTQGVYIIEIQSGNHSQVIKSVKMRY